LIIRQLENKKSKFVHFFCFWVAFLTSWVN
jgi:hypothetical protein